MPGLSPPSISNSNAGTLIRHREYLGDVLASVAFNTTQYPLNPGLFATFPWLSAVASSYEQYRLRGVLFEFKSLSSDAVLSSATSSALGSVIMATQYDALDTPFLTKFDMENYQFANSSKPSMSFIHPIECSRTQSTLTELYIRTGAVPTGGDQRFYDFGVFTIATVGMQAAGGVAGELWCTYEIELIKPKFITAEGGDILTDHFVLTSVTNGSPLGTTTNPTANSSIGGYITSNRIYHFPSYLSEGVFMFQHTVTGAGAVSVAAYAIVPTNCVVKNIMSGGTSNEVSSTGTGVVTFFVTYICALTGSQATLACGTAGTLPTTFTSGDLFVTQLPTQLN
jgi:hypothetical protein